MAAVLDHVFICTGIGAPAAEKLREFGLTEGTPNRHPGQGTACRRFFFHNAMLELVWVENAEEARSEQTRPTRLWDRWSQMGSGTSPFGIILRPPSGTTQPCPFPAWEYRPATMPDLRLHIASNTALNEPMWCYMESGRAPIDAPPDRRQPIEHSAGFRKISDLTVTCPQLNAASLTGTMADRGVIHLAGGLEHLIELQFDGAAYGARRDFRPELPLAFRW